MGSARKYSIIESMGRYKWSSQEEILLKILKNIRTVTGMSQRDLMQKLERPQSYISKYETGERRLDLLELKELCDACGIKLVDVAQQVEDEIDTSKGKQQP